VTNGSKSDFLTSIGSGSGSTRQYVTGLALVHKTVKIVYFFEGDERAERVRQHEAGLRRRVDERREVPGGGQGDPRPQGRTQDQMRALPLHVSGCLFFRFNFYAKKIKITRVMRIL
jgi:hypothetical protein